MKILRWSLRDSLLNQTENNKEISSGKNTHMHLLYE